MLIFKLQLNGEKIEQNIFKSLTLSGTSNSAVAPLLLNTKTLTFDQYPWEAFPWGNNDIFLAGGRDDSYSIWSLPRRFEFHMWTFHLLQTIQYIAVQIGHTLPHQATQRIKDRFVNLWEIVLYWGMLQGPKPPSKRPISYLRSYGPQSLNV